MQNQVRFGKNIFHLDGDNKPDEDIAIIEVIRPFKLAKHIYPACLPTHKPRVDDICYTSGWGKTEKGWEKQFKLFLNFQKMIKKII